MEGKSDKMVKTQDILYNCRARPRPVGTLSLTAQINTANDKDYGTVDRPSPRRGSYETIYARGRDYIDKADGKLSTSALG